MAETMTAQRGAPVVHIGAFVPPAVRQRLRNLAAEQNRSMSQVMREAVEQYLSKHAPR